MKLPGHREVSLSKSVEQIYVSYDWKCPFDFRHIRSVFLPTLGILRGLLFPGNVLELELLSIKNVYLYNIGNILFVCFIIHNNKILILQGWNKWCLFKLLFINNKRMVSNTGFMQCFLEWAFIYFFICSFTKSFIFFICI